MPRRFSENRLIIASHNQGKVREIRELLAPFGIAVSAAGDHDLPEPEETGSTFIANAELKARAAALAAGLPALADDSGLAVAALDGAPGIYSARWAGPAKDFSLAMRKVEDGLAETARRNGGTVDRSAAFVCALSLCWPDGHCESVEGRCEGRLVWPPRGDKGFGYDPMFVPAGHDKTFGEVDSAWKHSVSHRADAFAKLLKRLGLADARDTRD